MKKMIDVGPYKFTYRLYNNKTNERYLGFASISDAISFAGKISNIKIYKRNVCHFFNENKKQKKLSVYELAIRILKRENTTDVWSITNNLGDVVSLDEIANNAPSYKYKPFNWSSDKGEQLVQKNDNVDKIKSSYATTKHNSHFGSWYSNDVRYGDRLNTHSEIGKNSLDNEEYSEYHVVRGKRNHLPTKWDDDRVSAYKSEKSWKHHSKRGKQWKIKDHS